MHRKELGILNVKILSKYKNYVMRQFLEGRKKIISATVAESLKFWLFHIFYLIHFAKKIVKDKFTGWWKNALYMPCYSMLWMRREQQKWKNIDFHEFFSFLFCLKCFFSLYLSLTQLSIPTRLPFFFSLLIFIHLKYNIKCCYYWCWK